MDLYILLDLYTIAGKASDHLYLYLQLHNQRVIYITQNRFNISHNTSYRTDFKHVPHQKNFKMVFSGRHKIKFPWLIRPGDYINFNGVAKSGIV